MAPDASAGPAPLPGYAGVPPQQASAGGGAPVFEAPPRSRL
jgi:hypothetical protein